jgi:UDP-glucuronate 4-epimerase
MDVVSLIEKNLGKKAEINFSPMQPGDVQESFADIEKSIEMLNFSPQTNIDEGIKEFVNWFNRGYYAK